MKIHEHADFERLWLAAGKKVKEKQYWLNKLSGEPVRSSFPSGYPDTEATGKTTGCAEVKFSLDKGLVTGLIKLSTGSDIRLHIVLTAISTLLLAKYTGHGDIILGTPVLKTDKEGELINTVLAIRNQLHGDMTFKDLLLQVRQTMIEADRHGDYPIELLVQQLNLPVGEEDFPLFDTAIMVENIHDKRYLDRVNPGIIFSFLRTGENIAGSVEYNPSRWHRQDMDRVIGHLRHLMEIILADVEIKIQDIDLLWPGEKEQLLIDFNDTAREYPRHKTIHELFLEQAMCTPDHAALVGARVQNTNDISQASFLPDEVQLTYRELNRESDNMAQLLNEKGVQSDTIVGIMLERSLEMIIGILGILKTGAAYLPINPGSPGERVDYMLKDSGAQILISDRNDVGTGQCPVPTHSPATGHRPLATTRPTRQNLAYIIYTSGSTGNPKGVPITHANFSQLIHWGYRQLGIGSKDRVIQNLSFYFDWSVWEIFIALTTGAVLSMITEEILLNPEAEVDFILEHAITVLHITPTQFQYLLNTGKEMPTLRWLFIGAEKLTCDLVERTLPMVSGDCRVFNMYGPTEATIIAAVLEIHRDRIGEYRGLTGIPIGRAVGNLELAVLDRYLKLCPIDVPGELYIAGDGVARGYLNNPGLTAQKFIFYRSYRSYKSNFSKKLYKTGDPAARGAYKSTIRYRTGDLARWQPDGNIQFLGRIDHQVKLRGYRVELGEIENRLLKHEKIQETVILLKEDKLAANRYICAYFVGVPGETVPADELRDYLSGYLPQYMIPSYFVRMDKIPLNPNGKIDRQKLPDPMMSRDERYAPPGNEIEKKLVELWAEVLGRDETHAAQLKSVIGIDNRFFNLGGHSLKVTDLGALLYKIFNVEFPLAELFKRDSIRQQAEYILRSNQTRYTGIESVEKKEYYPLSSAQKRLYFLWQMDPESTVYNIPLALHSSEEIDKEHIESTLKKLLARHESLRTIFIQVGEVTVQKVHDSVEFEMEYYDLSTGGEERKIENKDTPLTLTKNPGSIIKNFIRPFDLSRLPLIRSGIIKLPGCDHIWLVDMHHIISDGMSMEIFIKEFGPLYQGNKLPGLEIQYKDYSEWRNSKAQQAALLEQKGYWLKEFEGEIPVLNLPLDYPRPAFQGFAGNKIESAVGAGETARLKKLGTEQGATLYMVLLSLYVLFLSKLSNQEDIPVGTPVAARGHAELRNIIGMFVNTLALRHFIAGEMTFKEFLGNVKTRALNAFAHQDYPYEDLVDAVDVARDPGRNPLFDVFFVLQNMDIPTLEIPGLKPEPYPLEHSGAKFDLSLSCTEGNETLRLEWEYNTALFREETVQRFIRYFTQIITTVVEKEEITLSQIDMMPEEEKTRLLVDFNNTQRDYPREKTIHALFEEQVERTPDIVAVAGVSWAGFNSGFFTYRELLEKSVQLAYRLKEKSIRPDTIVGLVMERTIDMIIGILGILISGAAYLPINPKNPVERIKYLLAESSAGLLVTTRNLVDKAAFEKEIVYLPVENNGAGERNPVNYMSDREANNAFLQDLAYIIYTSGSTGNPKGVPITHSNFFQLIHWGCRQLGIGVKDRVIQNLSFYFDWSVWEIFITLTTGATLCMITEEISLNPEAEVDFILAHAITVLDITPTQFQYLLNTGKFMPTLRYLFIGAEKLAYDLVKQTLGIVSDDCRLFNMYGPTETTIIAAVLEIHRDNLRDYRELTGIPIGSPVGNLELSVLDRYLNLCPVNVPGELNIAGNGVARGYLNNPGLTAEKFIFYRSYRSYKSNFSKKLYKTGGPAARGAHKSNILYRTGDLARWLPDPAARGTYIIEFLGRLDHQVKIRGFRIETGEIENRLLKHDQIKEAIVIDRVDEIGDKYLCAYIITKTSAVIDELAGYLAQFLPGYMVPSFFVALERLPLTPNGKIDRKALPEPVFQKKNQSCLPRNRREAKLAGIWQEILGIPAEIGIDDNFFKLGGHSLKASIMAARVHRELEVKIPLAEIFKSPTIRGLAQYLYSAARETFTSIKPAEKKKYYPLSSSQTRFYILQEVTPGSTAYNMGGINRLDGRVEKEKIEKTLRKLLKRHESLKTSFHAIGGEPVQRIHDEVEFEIEYERSLVIGQWSLVKCQGRGEVSSPSLPEESHRPSVIRHLSSGFIRPFDLTRAPLLRLGLIKISEDRHVFMFDMHHIISDGTSMSIFLKEFMDLYAGEHLPELRLQYQDFAQWQYERLKSGKLKEQEDYWQKQFADGLPVLDMPTDFPRPAMQSFAGDRFDFNLDRTLTFELHRLVNDTGATLYMVLLAVYTVLLSRYSGQEDIVTGATIAGRPHADMQKIIGLFIETLVQRNYPAGHLRFDEFLTRVKQNTLEAYDNQDYPFRELIRKLGADKEVSRNPVFDAMLIVQNFETTEFELEGLKFSPYQPAEEETHQTSKVDFTLEAMEVGEEIHCRLEYCTRLYKRETMERLARHFINIAGEVTANPAAPLSAIAVIDEAEKSQLLETFNDTSYKVKGQVPGETVLERFDCQVEQTPDRVALVGKAEAKKRRGEEERKESFGGTTAPADSAVLPVGPVRPVRPVQPVQPVQLTYRQLNEQAVGLANKLKEKGVVPDTIVGFMVESSVEMAVGIWGILKAGGAYMPIDPEYPQDRIDYILKDSGTKILVTTTALVEEGEKVRRWEGEKVLLEEIPESLKNSTYPLTLLPSYLQNSSNPATGHRKPAATHPTHLTHLTQPTHQNLAYIIYTSGTTGRPKGVMVQHGNLANYVKAVENEVDLSPEYTILQQGSLCFDAFVEEFYPLLSMGGRVAIPGKMAVRDIPALYRYIARHRVNIISCAPQLINELNKALREGLPGISDPQRLLAALKILLVGGDRLKAEYIDKLLETVEIYNTYGPTESTVCATYYRCRDAADIPPDLPIGKPLSRYEIYLLGKYGNLVPIGVPGELCVGGPGVTRGYMNQPGLTAEKFCFLLTKSFWRGPGEPFFKKVPLAAGGKIYKTGDLARWYPDGNIEFLGRIDRQVKIRGYRIELAEIESRLAEVENIKEAVVVEREKKSGESILAAYVVSRGPLDAAAVKNYLARHMPDYMVPPYIMAVEAIPWTGTGKVDTQRLPHLETRSGAAQAFAAPGNQREKQIADIWKQVLEVDQVGIDDNFFDLGGTSLDIIQVSNRIKEKWNIVIPVVAFFTYTTVRSLVQYLGTGNEEERNRISEETHKEKEILEAIEKGQNKLKGRLKKEIPPQEQEKTQEHEQEKEAQALETYRGTGLEIAVIGMAGKFPGAENIVEFWENLKNGVESIHFFTGEELRAEGIDEQGLENPNYMKARSIITGAEYFDASFFGYNTREAGIMDPQIRVFEQCVWHTLEDAGYDPYTYTKRIGLYAGANPNLRWMAITALTGMQMGISGFMVAQLMDKDFMCTHISYKLNLKGPSYAFQTACSTSLVAIHMAVQSLLHGECEMALAGGVSVAFPYKQGYVYQEGMIYSADGHNRTFAAEATGSVFGDGAGAVLLKPLEEAAADRDHIYAVIKGTATNNDGSRKVGYTAPSVQGQMEVIRAAQLMAEVEPGSITYVETHGTATPLGDAVEIAALKQAFNTTKKGYCALSTVKSNMGHLYSAAGAAGFIKTVLALQHRLIPPMLHYTAPNPEIDFENSPFYVNNTLKEWKANGNPLRAGVSAFGIGGTNAHVVLEEWRTAPAASGTRSTMQEAENARQYQLILLSAKTPTALKKQSENLIAYLKKNPHININDMAYTLQVGRGHFPYRRMAISFGKEIDLDKLALYLERMPTAVVKNQKRPIVFMFCGQGSQYENMGQDLYRTEPVFRQEIDRCSEILKPLMHCDIKEVLYPSDRSDQFNRSNRSYIDINQTEFAQPVIFVFEYALARLLMDWGIKPRAMIGYSFGEYIAACIAGVFSLEDALKLITARGQLTQQTPAGAMTSVPLPEKDLRPLLKLNKNLSLAIVNGPTCIVSGPKAEVERFEKEMKPRRVLCVPLNMSQAIHSSIMEPIRQEFEKSTRSLRMNPPQIPYISNVTGQWITPEQAVSPGYWGDHLCSTVRYSEGLTELLKDENAIFIEIGAGRILGMMVRTHPDKKPGHVILNTVKHQQEKVTDDYFLLEKLGQLWLQGQSLDWKAFYRDEKRNRVPLPGYPFEGKWYWLDIDKTGLDGGSGRPGLPGLQILSPQAGTGPAYSPGTAAENLEINRPGAEDYEPPHDEIEEFIARWWQELLGEKRIGIHENFFQLNGNSLIATQLLAQLMEEYQVEIPANRFYQEPTIAHLAGVIKELKIEPPRHEDTKDTKEKV